MLRKRLTVAAVIALLASVALAAFTYPSVGNPLDPFDNRSFSAAAWRGASTRERAQMSRSAVARHLPPGLAASQVTQLLGPPDEILAGTAADEGGNGLPGVRTFSYSLGFTSPWGYDATFLYVHLDNADRILSAQIAGY